MEVKYITNRVAGGIVALQRRMKGDVKEMCERILMPLIKEFGKKNFPEELLERLRGYFRAIYWSLKVHSLIHLRISDHLKEITEVVNEVGARGGLTNEEMDKLPDQDHVVDPGSKLVEMVST